MQVRYRISPEVANEELDGLFADAWQTPPGTRNYAPVLRRSLGYVCAYSGDELVGFVNIAWDGGLHAFLLDTTVRSDLQRRGIGRELVRRAQNLARKAGASWLHVDYEPALGEFYRKCSFRETEAGLVDLTQPRGPQGGDAEAPRSGSFHVQP